MIPWTSCTLFKDCNESDLVYLGNSIRPVHYAPYQQIMKDGEMGDFLFILEQGQADIKKNDITLGTAHEGDAIGLAALVQDGKRTADVYAGADGASGQKLEKNTYHTFHSDGRLDLSHKMLHNVMRKQSDTLLQSNTMSAEEARAKLAIEQKRIESADFLGRILIGLIVFTFMHGYVTTHNHIDTMSPIFSVAVISGMGIWAWYIVKSSSLPLKTFGVRTDNFIKSMRIVMPATLLFLAAMIGVKWILTLVWPEQFGTRIFGLYMQSAGFSPITLVIMYSIHTVVQEFIARGCIQSGLEEFKSDPKAKWGPIIMAALMFASVHVVADFYFALLTILPGLFWGYLYHLERNIWSLSISHIIIGLFGLFFLGLVDG